MKFFIPLLRNKRYQMKFLLLGLFIFLSFESVLAQSSSTTLELTPYVGYMVGGKIRASNGDYSINSAPNIGLIVDIPVQRNAYVEFYYSYQSTSMDFWSLRDHTTETLFDLDVHYFMIGGNWEFQSYNKDIVWFGTAALGASFFHPKATTNYRDVWRFTVNFGGGAKIFFSERIGIRLQALLNIPIQWGGAYYYGGASVAGGTTFVQGNFLAGLIFKI
jgi:hypothetical protein